MNLSTMIGSIIAEFITLANGTKLLVLKGYTFSRNSRIRKGGSRYMCSNAFSRACPAFAHINAQNVIIRAVTDHTHPPGVTNQKIPQFLMYQDYSFTRSDGSLMKSDANEKDKFSYRCSKADSNGCEAYLHVNLAGDVLSAFIAHNHTPENNEEVDFDFYMDLEPKLGKSRCTKRQMKYLIDYMLKNQDLAMGPKDNRFESLDILSNKWQTLAFNLAKIGPPKSIKHLKATWRDLKKGARAEIASLAYQVRGSCKVVPSEKTCKVFAAIGHPIDVTKKLGLKELAELRKTTSASVRPNIFRNIAASAQDIFDEEESTDILVSSRNRCTKAQITCLVNYMEQNKDFAMSELRDSSSLKKWRELESKLAKIGPWKSAKHLMGTWDQLQKHARKMSIVAVGEEGPSPNIMKVINIMGLPLVFLVPGEIAEDHDYGQQPTATVTDDNTKCSQGDDDEEVNDNDDDDSSGIFPIFEVDSYP